MIKVNVLFTVVIKKINARFNAVCLSDDNGESFDKNIIKKVESGEVFTVEDQWFNYRLTGRKIIYHK